ncbi:hypothetical protein GMI69_05120 [Eggerthellaceae bacterium zg-887]|uniref:protein kinase domain-containing protein n=1 Tax=Xiamenia xianingshaonis TaxID=2682776 RepID=UPI0014097E1C|nr:hypothetical protein [Xiamenia xianingshaonis]NHM16048.1 hypothetical protein [Xiamenia xianingshaonis]
MDLPVAQEPPTAEPSRTTLDANSTQGATLRFPSFTCEKVKALSLDGASGIVYEALSHDLYGTKAATPARLTIKECYPLDAAPYLQRSGTRIQLAQNAPMFAKLSFEESLERFDWAIAVHTSLHQGKAKEFVSTPIHYLKENGTTYLVSDASDGFTLDRAIDKMSGPERIAMLASLCDAVIAVHGCGYYCLDLKPTNIITFQGAAGARTKAVLFDFDSTLAKGTKAERETSVLGTKNWSGYEVFHPGRRGIDMRTDLYSIGAILLWMAYGRPPTTTEVIHARGSWNADEVLKDPAFSSFGSRAKELIAKILGKTLVVDPDDRYLSAQDLKRDVQMLLELVSPISETAKQELGKIESNASEAIRKAEKEARKSRLARWCAILAVVAAMIVAVATITLFPRSEPDPLIGRWESIAVFSAPDDGSDAMDGETFYLTDDSTRLAVRADGTGNVVTEQGEVLFSWRYSMEVADEGGSLTRTYVCTNIGTNDEHADAKLVVSDIDYKTKVKLEKAKTGMLEALEGHSKLCTLYISDGTTVKGTHFVEQD